MTDNLRKRRIKKNDIVMYLILIPFFFPRGFGEYSEIYKLFYTLWLYISSALIAVNFINKIAKRRIKMTSYLWWLILFHVYLVIDTLIIQKGIHEGLQKMFVVPVLCLGCYMYLSTKPYAFIVCVSNILIAFFLLNLCVFNPVFFKQYFSPQNKLLFLGHVQMAGQIGLLGLLLVYLIKQYKRDNRKATMLLLLSLLTMAMSMTMLALVCIIIFLFGSLLRKIKCSGILNWSHKRYFVVFIIIQSAFLCYLVNSNWSFERLGISTTLHGRLTIWSQIMTLLKDHWIFGYGTYGYKIQVYWSAWTNAEGMIYAHNQMFQLLLDGGIVLLILFIAMVFSYLSKSKTKSENAIIKRMSNLILIAFFVIMLTESPTEYYYFFAVLSFYPFLEKQSGTATLYNIKRGRYP